MTLPKNAVASTASMTAPVQPIIFSAARRAFSRMFHKGMIKIFRATCNSAFSVQVGNRREKSRPMETKN